MSKLTDKPPAIMTQTGFIERGRKNNPQSKDTPSKWDIKEWKYSKNS